MYASRYDSFIALDHS